MKARCHTLKILSVSNSILHDFSTEAYSKFAKKYYCLGWNKCLIDLEIFFLEGIPMEHAEIKGPTVLMEQTLAHGLNYKKDKRILKYGCRDRVWGPCVLAMFSVERWYLTF